MTHPRIASSIVATLVWVGCAAEVEDLSGVPSTTSEVAEHLKGSKADFGGDCEPVHQASRDITVLSARILGRFAPDTNTVPADFNVDCSRCDVLEQEETNGYDCQFYDVCVQQTLDCSSEISRLTDMPFVNGAVFDNVYYVANQPSEDNGWEGHEDWHSEGFNCSVLEITTAARSEALPTAATVGFWFDGEFTQLSLRDAMEVGTATFNTGEAATLHRFGAVAICWRGSVSSSMSTEHEFKPFLKYEGDDGRCYFNWDAVESNYRISSFTREFDRSWELLQ